MNEAVTDVIVERSREAEGLATMMMWSVVAHAIIVALALLVPDWQAQEPPRTVMTITLGGVQGPRSAGLTQTGGRTVQETSPEPVKRVETPPAPKPPAMTLPDPKPRPRTRAKPQQAPREAPGRTPSTGDEPREGSTPTETGARGQGFGLSTGGGGVGGQVTLDVDFCCPEYLTDMVLRIQRNWDPRQGLTGSTGMKFTILRDGTIRDVQIERPSGFAVLDNAANLALLRTARLPPLPGAFPNPDLTVHLRFDFQR